MAGKGTRGVQAFSTITNSMLLSRHIIVYNDTGARLVGECRKRYLSRNAVPVERESSPRIPLPLRPLLPRKLQTSWGVRGNLKPVVKTEKVVRIPLQPAIGEAWGGVPAEGVSSAFELHNVFCAFFYSPLLDRHGTESSCFLGMKMLQGAHRRYNWHTGHCQEKRK